MRYNFEVLMVPAEDIPGVWVAMCPRLALCTQGNSPANAREMMEEAIEMVFEADAAAGYDPLKRELAHPLWDEIRQEIEDVRLHGVSVDLSQPPMGGHKRLLVMVSTDQGKAARASVGADLRLCG